MYENDFIGMSNQTEYKTSMNWTVTIGVFVLFKEAFKSKIKMILIRTIINPQNSLGPNPFVRQPELINVHNYTIYKVKVVDERVKKPKIAVSHRT